jgi:rod shape-determining protein MreD
MILKNIYRFVIVLLIQVLVINNITLGSYVYPAFYVYFILLLPFESKGWVLLITAFLMGLGVDFFSNSPGLNASAAVFMAFCRPLIIHMLKTKKEYEPGLVPGIRDTGFGWFFTYSLLLILLHHSFLFFVEAFSFENIRQTFYRILFSSGATLGLVLLAQIIVYKQRKR